MSKNGVFLRRRRSEEIDGFGDVSSSDYHDVHVLAVDDSLVVRKVIERLLKITSCKVTAVDSGRKALQFLGLDEEKSSVAFRGFFGSNLRSTFRGFSSSSEEVKGMAKSVVSSVHSLQISDSVSCPFRPNGHLVKKRLSVT